MKWKRILCGMPVTFLGLIIFSGSVENAGATFFISVICTAGIGLVFWIPLWWFVGWMTLELIGIFMNKRYGKEEAAAKHRPLSRDEVELTEYIRHAEARGMGDDEIDRLLRRQGFNEYFIQKARQRLNS